MLSTHCSCHILMKVEFSLQIFEKCTKSKLYDTFISGNRVFPSGRTDRHRQAGRQMDGQADRRTERHEEDNSHFSQFCEKSLKTDLISKRGRRDNTVSLKTI
jgi:hypothetical protein